MLIFTFEERLIFIAMLLIEVARGVVNKTFIFIKSIQKAAILFFVKINFFLVLRMLILVLLK